MFYKILTQNLNMAKLVFSSHIWSTTKDGPSMLPSCLPLRIWYLQQQCSKQKIDYNFVFKCIRKYHLVVVTAISPSTVAK
jgi:hypothetical protein